MVGMVGVSIRSPCSVHEPHQRDLAVWRQIVSGGTAKNRRRYVVFQFRCVYQQLFFPRHLSPRILRGAFTFDCASSHADTSTTTLSLLNLLIHFAYFLFLVPAPVPVHCIAFDCSSMCLTIFLSLSVPTYPVLQCYVGYYGVDCSNISCPGTFCYYDPDSHEQVSE
jgi:hypothetical protein